MQTDDGSLTGDRLTYSSGSVSGDDGSSDSGHHNDEYLEKKKEPNNKQ